MTTTLTGGFKTSPNRWDRNRAESETAHAEPVRRMDTNGTTHPGVGIFAGNGPRLILDPADALRLANQIADVLTTIRNTTERN